MVCRKDATINQEVVQRQVAVAKQAEDVLKQPFIITVDDTAVTSQSSETLPLEQGCGAGSVQIQDVCCECLPQNLCPTYNTLVTSIGTS